MIAPGIAYYSRAGKYKEVRRGIHMKQTIQELVESEQGRHTARLKYSMLTVDGLGKMLATNRPELFNVLREMDKFIDCNADTKRIWPDPWVSAHAMAMLRQTSVSRVLV